MSDRPPQPEPFIRGCLFSSLGDTPYPRANPADAEHLPADVWAAAQVPASVRLELVGDAQAVDIQYRTATGDLGYRGNAAGSTFAAFRGGQKVAEEEAVLGDGLVRLFIPGEPFRPAVIYLPEGMMPTIYSITPLGGTIEPAAMQPRWLVYGDAVAQGWLSSSPSMAWPAVVARKLGLDLCNLGYAGSARAETTSAALLADTPAEAITVAYGINCWNRIPHSTGLMAESIRAFLGVVRSGHPTIPVVVLSPLLRPDAETVPNRLGATMADLRVAMEEAVRECMAAGDNNLFLVEGGSAVGEADLADNVYPGDEGHKRIAAAVGKHLSPLMPTLRQAAESRWTALAGKPLPRPNADGSVVPGVSSARGVSMRSILGLDNPPGSPARAMSASAPAPTWVPPAPAPAHQNPMVVGGTASGTASGTAPVIGAAPAPQTGTVASGVPSTPPVSVAPAVTDAAPSLPPPPPPPSLSSMVSNLAPKLVNDAEARQHQPQR